MLFSRLFRKKDQISDAPALAEDAVASGNTSASAGDAAALANPMLPGASPAQPRAPKHTASNSDATPRTKPSSDPADAESNEPPSTMSAVLDIYTKHFGLSERPFSLVPDPDFLYWSDQHRRAFSMLEYGIMTRSPITLITGDVGAGKTTLLHHLLKSVKENVRIGLISNAQGGRGDVLRWVMVSLDQEVERNIPYAELFSQFQNYLIEEYSQGRRVILIFDEAQNLSREALEELRMFTNINSNKDELLQLVLMGQPELREIIAQPDLKQFAQRVASNYHLNAMSAGMVGDYITHRLEVAGSMRAIFEPEAVHLIHEATGGVPRLINQLCDLSMVYTFTGNRDTVNEATVRQVLNEGVFFGGGIQKYPPLPLGRDTELSAATE